MPQPKKQKQEKVLSKLELELEGLIETWNRFKNEQGAYDSYIVQPPSRYNYVKNQVSILRQKLGLKRTLVCPKCFNPIEVRYCHTCGEQVAAVEIWK